LEGDLVTVLDVWARAGSNIDQRAKTLRPRQVALFVLAAVPVLVGILAALVWRAVWTAFSWVWAAAIEGWEMGLSLTTRKDGGA